MHRNFLLQKHIIFLKRCLDVLPEAYEQLDTSRLTLLYFILSGLDLVSALDEISSTRKQAIVKWIYSLQLGSESGRKITSGFRGSHCNSVAQNKRHSHYDESHIAMTYSALACLTILNDDLSGLDTVAIKCGIKSCQLLDGSFCGCKDSESDMRFVYCAVASCKILNDFSCLNIDKLLCYVKQCFNYDGGFGQTPGTESHGGSTYCAVAALFMLDRLTQSNGFFTQIELDKLKKWCLMRQNEGFFGRPNKPDDSCYTFWIGATLKMLGCIHFVDAPKAIDFTLSTQDAQVGGFGKYADVTPDLLHTYLSLAGLSILNMDGLRPLDPTLNITFRSLTRRSQNSIKASNIANDLPANNAFTDFMDDNWTMPGMPVKWSRKSGWTRYDSRTGSEEHVAFPAEDVLVFDVEICASVSAHPILATAVSKTSWYSWCSRRLDESYLRRHVKNPFDDLVTVDDLIPVEPTSDRNDVPADQRRERIIIGHNVGFDRTFLKEQYSIQATKMRFFDTMSAHIAVSGLAGDQRIEFQYHKTGRHTKAYADATGYDKRMKEVSEEQKMFNAARWMNSTCMNNLADVHEFYCGGKSNLKISKDERETFVKGTLEDVAANFQDLFIYCAKDTIATLEVYKVLMKLFFERFPSPTTLFGMLEMSTTYLTVNDNWFHYLQSAEETFQFHEKRVKKLLVKQCDRACSMLHSKE